MASKDDQLFGRTQPSDDREIERFISSLQALEFRNVFNPYKDICELADDRNSPRKRRDNLMKVLRSGRENADVSLWIGRDLGYLGGRRTGVALTDEQMLPRYAKVLGVDYLERPTVGSGALERTAKTVVCEMEKVGRRIITWNVFPFHPHLEGNPHSNRCHSRAERNAALFSLEWMIDFISPREIVGIGLDAAKTLQTELCVKAQHVRHPSYGGIRDFRAGIASLYSLPLEVAGNTQEDLFA
jgi:uracil-DNA glycosylase